MKLKEYLESLNDLAKENPELLESQVIYSSDDEGNSYEEVYYTASVVKGEWEGREFCRTDSEDDDWLETAICIN